MTPELKQLEEILKRNADDPDAIDIENEVEHYFLFDRIHDPKDREEAWSLFAERAEIRRRLAHVEAGAGVVAGWGYRVPGHGGGVDEETLKWTVRRAIENLRPILVETGDSEDIVDFIDTGFEILIAPPDEPTPSAQRNDLLCAIHAAIDDYRIERMPWNKPHYVVLNHWAIYLTKCDEVAAYLLWPCLKGNEALPADTMEPLVALWKLRCRDRYWIRNGDLSSRAIHVRPPWMDAAKP